MFERMTKKIRNLMLYAGVDYDSYLRIKPKIIKTNRIMTAILSAISTILIAAMLIFSLKSDSVSQNRIVYQFGVLLSFFVMILSLTIAEKYNWIVTPLVYILQSIYYIYGILIGTITDPGQKTVTFMVLLVFLPAVFIVRPACFLSVSIFYIVIFIILCKLNKEGVVLSNDIADAISFGILGAVSGIIINHVKVKGYVLERELKEINKKDQLTQMKNRNAYELEAKTIPNKCKNSLACIYIDVNGLHEINNTLGHEHGDIMLKHIAIEIKEAFTDKYTYRMGGDEFVAFVPDQSEEAITAMINKMIEKVESEGYHIAVGYEVSEIMHNVSIEDLKKSADRKMYQNKKNYYNKHCNKKMRR